jgi:[ribosomal protein S5]-alanine N-acetyltransferase
MKTLETERLILRPWRESDLDDFYEYGKDPEVGPNAGWKPHDSKEESLGILRSFVRGDEVRAIELKENGKAVGSLGLHPDRLRHEGMGSGREIGYVLSRDYWGRGLMTEAVRRAISFAFEEAGLDYVSCAHFPFNARSKRVIEKCGFRYEKYLAANCADYAGTKQDEVCYILTRDEYFARKAADRP